MSAAGFAIVPIKFGDRIIEPGEEVPYEPGRNYSLMIRLGQMAPYRERKAAGGHAAGSREREGRNGPEEAHRPVGRPRKDRPAE